ncbi:unnamed protein product [Vitrella brassicaformis CCMP3155]|uniref:Uncharacterized protein n=2 Tax=Vitrella brassicaformis TaxID=1169539 RepID=A0A0G4FZG5_VITBC|nr:unnamed protein product [Vitrella brassicaformis CCMP3155]|eukprot:CEM20656.1 unnamed protein product [Vitrella brassicaformis CCMP3155]
MTSTDLSSAATGLPQVPPQHAVFHCPFPPIAPPRAYDHPYAPHAFHLQPDPPPHGGCIAGHMMKPVTVQRGAYPYGPCVQRGGIVSGRQPSDDGTPPESNQDGQPMLELGAAQLAYKRTISVPTDGGGDDDGMLPPAPRGMGGLAASASAPAGGAVVPWMGYAVLHSRGRGAWRGITTLKVVPESEAVVRGKYVMLKEGVHHHEGDKDFRLAFWRGEELRMKLYSVKTLGFSTAQESSYRFFDNLPHSRRFLEPLKGVSLPEWARNLGIRRAIPGGYIDGMAGEDGQDGMYDESAPHEQRQPVDDDTRKREDTNEVSDELPLPQRHSHRRRPPVPPRGKRLNKRPASRSPHRGFGGRFVARKTTDDTLPSPVSPPNGPVPPLLFALGFPQPKRPILVDLAEVGGDGSDDQYQPAVVGEVLSLAWAKAQCFDALFKAAGSEPSWQRVNASDVETAVEHIASRRQASELRDVMAALEVDCLPLPEEFAQLERMLGRREGVIRGGGIVQGLEDVPRPVCEGQGDMLDGERRMTQLKTVLEGVRRGSDEMD